MNWKYKRSRALYIGSGSVLCTTAQRSKSLTASGLGPGAISMRGHGLVRDSLGISSGGVGGNGEVIPFGALSFSLWGMA